MKELHGFEEVVQHAIDNQPRPTPAAAWVQGQLVQLPSEKFALLRQPDVIGMIAEDGEVAQVFLSMSNADPNEQQASDNPTDQMKMVADLAPFINRLVMASFIEPEVVRTRHDIADPNSQISLADVALQDKVAVMNWVMGGLSALANFRPQQTGAVGLVPKSQANRKKAKRPVG